MRSIQRWVRERFTQEGKRQRDHRLYDARTFQIMKRVLKPDSACIDVGCHEGAILQRMIQYSPNGKHIAFEPIPFLANKLRERFPKVEIHEVALGDKPGRASFVHVTSNPAYSGLRVRRYDRPDEELQQIEVEVVRLDDRLPGDLPIRFIKIDVEGAELGVLRGGKRTIEKWRPYIVFEHGLGAADYYGTGPGDVYDLLGRELGLRLSLLDRWLARRTPLTREEFIEQFQSGANYYFVAHP